MYISSVPISGEGTNASSAGKIPSYENIFSIYKLNFLQLCDLHSHFTNFQSYLSESFFLVKKCCRQWFYFSHLELPLKHWRHLLFSVISFKNHMVSSSPNPLTLVSRPRAEHNSKCGMMACSGAISCLEPNVMISSACQDHIAPV